MTSPTGEKDFSLSERERDCDLSSISACDFDVLMYKVSVGNELSLAKLLVFENTSIYLWIVMVIFFFLMEPCDFLYENGS